MTTDRTQPARSTALPDRSAPAQRPAQGNAFASLLDAHATPSRGDEAPVRRDDRAPRLDDGAAPRGEACERRDDVPAPDAPRPDHDLHTAPERPTGADAAAPAPAAPDVATPAQPQTSATAAAPALVLTDLPVLPLALAVAVEAAKPVPAAEPAQPAAPTGDATAIVPAPAPATTQLPGTPAPAASQAPAAALVPAPAQPEATDVPADGEAPVAHDAPAQSPAPRAAAPAPQAPAPTPGQPAADAPVAEPTTPSSPAPAQPAATATPAADTPATAPATPTAATPVAPALPTSQPLAGTLAPHRTTPLHRAPAEVATLLHVASERGITRAKMALRPVELGGIEIRLQSTAAGISAQVVADSPEAARMLAQHGDELRRALEARNVTLLSLEVSTSGDQQRENARGDWTDGDDAGLLRSRGANGDAEGDADTTPTTESVIELPGGLLVDVLA
jgi:flagellar hook-length control protein FliK